MIYRAIAAFLCACLVACSGISAPPAPKTPAQAVFELKAAEGAALAVMVQYKGLPSCTLPVHPVVCSDPAIVMKAQAADAVAAASIDTAEMVARDPNGDASRVQALIAAANTALAALTAITTTLKVK